MLFEKAYCNQAVCSPSRNALLTSLRPQTLGIYELSTNFRKGAPEDVHLLQSVRLLAVQRDQGAAQVLTLLGVPAKQRVRGLVKGFREQLGERFLLKARASEANPEGNFRTSISLM